MRYLRCPLCRRVFGSNDVAHAAPPTHMRWRPRGRREADLEMFFHVLICFFVMNRNRLLLEAFKIYDKAVNDINLNIEKPLWGSFKLSRNQMVKGNLFFKVNKTFDPQTFEWKESDRVIINFSQ